MMNSRSSFRLGTVTNLEIVRLATKKLRRIGINVRGLVRLKSDQYRIDSHKLMLHPDRVLDLLNNGDCLPLYMEISPSGSCNHRCTFCAVDFMGYEKHFLNAYLLIDFMTQARGLGLKSVMLGGEGEPLLHPMVDYIVKELWSIGLDVACTTNGVLLTEHRANQVLPHLTWIKISIDAGTEFTYHNVHRAPFGDFNKVLKNLEATVRIKKKNKYTCTIGTQALLLPENKGEMVQLASLVKDIGVDYFVIKPYSQHFNSEQRTYEGIKYEEMLDIQKEVEVLNDDHFQIIFRADTMRHWDEGEQPYDHCLAHPLWAYLDSRGTLWGCSGFLGNDKFNYGSISSGSFLDLWYGDKRKICQKSIESMSISQCRLNCRMESCNRYIWELKHPGPHVNFI